MALKRSSGVGAVTLCVALVAGSEALGYAADDGAAIRRDDIGVGRRAHVRRDGGEDGAFTVVAKRGFGRTGRKTAPSSGE